MARRILFILFTAVAAAGLHAQRVSDVDFEQFGKQVRITYRLDKATDIQIFLSTDGGRTFGQPLKAVTGDAGKNITTGSKTVLWSPLDEMDRLVSNDIVFKVVPAKRGSETVLSSTAEGRLPGKFSVSPTMQVQFSQGNLQYQASTNTWRFAEHQWNVVGMGYGLTSIGNKCHAGGNVENSDNCQIASDYNGWIDLFGWGTGNSPTKSGTGYSDYFTFTDWGVNHISNGGNKTKQWRTLTVDEWVYVFQKRPNASNKYGAAKVNDMTGVVVLPDDWVSPAGCSFTPGMTSASSGADWGWVNPTNVYTEEQWTSMEEAGAVFLPAAGERKGFSVSGVGSFGHYWSTTANGSYHANSVYFYSYDFFPQDDYYLRGDGFAVRLVSKL